MSANDHRSPLPTTLTILAMVGAGWFFFQNFQVGGLDGISIYKKGTVDDYEFVSYGDQPAFGVLNQDAGWFGNPSDTSSFIGYNSDNPFTAARQPGVPSVLPEITSASSAVVSDRTSRSRGERFRNLRIGSWALDGFGNAKLSDDEVRSYLIRVIRQFDVIALQQISAMERDVIPLLVDACNGAVSRVGEPRYDFVLGAAVGPPDAQEQLAFIYDSDRVRVDRNQTYTVEDPSHQMTYDPLVAWFQATEPDKAYAWTFSLVNVRVDLGRAATEVALLPGIFAAICRDGRGEDDVVMAGLFQADDAYLLPSVLGEEVRAAVSTVTTEIMGKHQTSNILVDVGPTNEFVGRGGVLDFLRIYNLSLEEAGAVSTQLPVFAEFSANEGGVEP